MCIDAMDIQGSCEKLRPCAGRGQKCTKWRPRKCIYGSEEKRLKKWRANNATAKKYQPHSRNRKACDKRSYWVRFVCRYKAKHVASLMKLKSGVISSGTMAPDNTTQYLMHIVYEDLMSNNDTSASVDPAVDFTGHDQRWSIYGDFSSPQNVYSFLDSAYESTVKFQERDFENVFQLYSGSS